MKITLLRQGHVIINSAGYSKQIIIRQGDNELPDLDFDLLRNDDVFNWYVEQGLIVFAPPLSESIGSAQSAHPKSSPDNNAKRADCAEPTIPIVKKTYGIEENPLKKVNAKNAEKIARRTTSISALKSWLVSEKRSTVITTIKKQIKKLSEAK